jgi:stearoyl-CoA desaturase (delta-9 desaturase)
MWVLLGLLLPAAVGATVTMDGRGFLLGGLWGGVVRLFFTYHFTNSVNSVMHLFGSRSFDTPDRSTNNIWLVLPTLGEAWHNNHHASPSTAIFAFKRWQIDPGGWIIRALERAGLIWDIKTAKPARVKQKELFED